MIAGRLNFHDLFDDRDAQIRLPTGRDRSWRRYGSRKRRRKRRQSRQQQMAISYSPQAALDAILERDTQRMFTAAISPLLLDELLPQWRAVDGGETRGATRRGQDRNRATRRPLRARLNTSPASPLSGHEECSAMEQDQSPRLPPPPDFRCKVI